MDNQATINSKTQSTKKANLKNSASQKLFFNKTTLKKSFLDSLPVMAGYIFMGMGFGVIMQGNGYSFIWAGIMALTIISGSMQYVAANLLVTGSSFIMTALMTLAINARYFFYGLSMLGKYREVKHGRWYLISTLTDETFSLTSTFDDNAPENKGVSRHGYYFLLSAMNHCYWIIGCVSGAIIGSKTSFNTAGVEFAMTALFVTIVVDQWMSGKNRAYAAFSIILSVVMLLILGDNFVIPTMVILSIASVIKKPSKNDYEQTENQTENQSKDSLASTDTKPQNTKEIIQSSKAKEEEN